MAHFVDVIELLDALCFGERHKGRVLYGCRRRHCSDEYVEDLYVQTFELFKVDE